MSQKTIQSIVRFLGCSGTVRLPVEFSKAAISDWQRVLDWLDSSGLALYLLRALKQQGLTESVPREFLARLETRQTDNRKRTTRMRETFDLLNRRFKDTGVQYAALKGFSLVPEYCPDPSFRAQSDLDYLVTPDSLNRAHQVLTEHVFLLKAQTGCESAYWIPCEEPKDSSVQYDPEAAYMVELHTALWDHGINDVPMAMRSVDMKKLQQRSRGQSSFYSLPDNEIFIGQILHCFRHFMQGLVRPSWLFEINHFAMHGLCEEGRFRDIVELTDAEPLLAEIVGIMLALIEQIFESEQSSGQHWIRRLSPRSKLWIERYGRDVAYERSGISQKMLLPKAKFLLFLQEQFPIYSEHRRQLWWKSLVPVGAGLRFWRKGRDSKSTPRKSASRKNRWITSRAWYHAGANARLIAELPRWFWTTRSSLRATPHSPVSRF